MKNRLLVNLVAVAALAVLVAFASGASSAAPRATLLGTVTDPSGAVIPDASVSISSNHFTETVATGDDGRYSVSGLNPGHYRVEVHAAGFTPLEKSGLVLATGQETEADAQLAIRATRQEVTVTAALP